MVNDMKNDFEIVTPRLVLRQRNVEDAEMIADAMQPVWRDLQMWMSWAHDGENTVESIRKSALTAHEGRYTMIGSCRETGKFVLMTGLHLHENEPDQYETGYWTAKEFLGKGFATEACNAAIHWGFNVLAAQSMYICHDEGNEPSRRIIEKLGFTKTGVRTKAQARCLDGVLMDLHDYIMTDPSVLPALDVTWRPRCP